MKKLYRFHVDCGRSGDLRGLFVADDEADIKPAIGLKIHFGEVLGKHSDVTITLEDSEVQPLTDDAAFIAKFEEYDCASGFNPLAYIECPDCGDSLEAPYAKCSGECEWEREP